MNIVRFSPGITFEVQQQIDKDRQERKERLDQQLSVLIEEVWQQSGQEEEVDFATFERSLWDKLMSVGLAACELFLASKRKPPEKSKIQDGDGKTYKYAKEKSYPLRSIFGEGTYTSSQYLRGKPPYKAQKEIVLLDGQVGLFPAGGLSPNLVLQVAELSTRMPYEQVCEVLGRFYAYVPSKRSICGLIDLLGPHAALELEDLECQPAEVVVIQVDGRGLPHIQDEEMEKRCQPHQKHPESQGRRRRRKHQADPRRTKGKKAKKKKQVTVGLIYTLKRLEDGSLEGPVSKLYVARFGNAEAVFQWLNQAVEQMGSEFEKIVFISDGAPQYTNLRKKYFPEAIAVIDFYHVCEYLWKAGETLYKEGSKELVAFVKKLKDLLFEEKGKKVVEILRNKEKELPKRGPGSKGKRERMKEAIRYIANRLDLMPYKSLWEQGIEIGSGAIESAVRQVVALRFDGPGMRWGKERPQMLLDLLCLRLSSGWKQLEHRMGWWTHQHHQRGRMTPIGVNEKKTSRKPASHSKPLKEKENLDAAA